MAVTLKDIARDLGVSVITVSKALRDHSDISEETKARVLKRVKEMNYRPNLAARALVTGRTNLLGFVVPDLLHSFFSEIVRGVSTALHNTSYTLVTTSSEQDPKLERQAVEQLIARRVDALLVASTQWTVETFRRVEEAGIPYIAFKYAENSGQMQPIREQAGTFADSRASTGTSESGITLARGRKGDCPSAARVWHTDLCSRLVGDDNRRGAAVLGICLG